MAIAPGLRPQRKKYRLRRNKDFQAVYSRGHFFSTPLLVLYCLPQKMPAATRIGYSVARKLGNAVRRNRMRRRLRALVRLQAPALPATGYDLILLARQSAYNRTYHDLELSYAKLLQRFKRWHLEQRATRRE